MAFLRQNDGGNGNGTCERAASSLVYARNNRASRLCCSTLICIHRMQPLTFLLCPFVAT